MKTNYLHRGMAIALSRAEVGRNEKGTVDSGGCRDDTGAGERFGRGPRRGGGPPVLWWWFLPPLLGSVLGTLLEPLLWRVLLWASQRRRGQAGHQGEGRPSVHQWRLRWDDAR